MSELTNNNRKSLQAQLLTTVSSLALIGIALSGSKARATEDGERHPTVWVELGGQLSGLADEQEAFAPSLMDGRAPEFSSSTQFEEAPRFSIEEVGSISIEPHASDWMFKASVRYGRSLSNKHVRQQTNPKAFITYLSGHRYAKYPSASKFADTNSQIGENHLIIDFQVGKDVGLGLFGTRSSSHLSLGVRFAQFQSASNIALKSDPDWHFHYLSLGSRYLPLGGTYHSNLASLEAARSFRGIGPSISWTGATPFLVQRQDSELTFDWGLNAAVLFGRQRAKVHYQTTGHYHTAKYHGSPPNVYHSTPSHRSVTPPARSRSVVVPNLGAFAGLSFRYNVAKVSFGYRADFFLGAMDGGIDGHKSYDRNFYGPYATVSIGLGG